MPRRLTSRVLDFARGIIGGVSPYGKRVRHGRALENVTLEPLGALTVRSGSQRLSSAVLSKRPHSLMEWVTASTGHLFAGCDDATGTVIECKAGAFTAQTLPFALQPSAKLVWDQLHGALWVAEQGGANPLMFYRASNPANTFLTGVLPRPAFMDIADQTAVTVVSGTATLPAGTKISGAVVRGAVTLTLTNNAGGVTGDCVLNIGGIVVPNCQLTLGSPTVTYDGPGAAAGLQFTLAGAGGGGLTPATNYWYRLRYRYLDGASRSSAPQLIAMGANTQVQLANIANEIRSDYVGWTLERTKAGGTVVGPYYFVADSVGVSQTTYNDVKADADLGYLSDENLHGEPPHLDGVLAFKDRLVGWAGSTLYFSQAVDDLEGTGIANWDAENSSDVDDDGDPIAAVVLSVDRLAVIKHWSAWIVEGNDITTYRAFPVYHGAGCAGPRAAVSVGPVVYFWGEAGLHRIVRNACEPFGWLEVGHLLKTVAVGTYGDIVLKNYLGQFLLASFSRGSGTNDDILAYDIRFGAWTRITGWYANDLLVQKAGTFGDARALVMADRRDLDAGAGTDYPVWLGFHGFKDEKASDGSGGSAPAVVIETPWIDDNTPDQDKDWEQIQAFLSGTALSASITIDLDPQASASVSLAASQSGALWGASTWGAFTWAHSTDAAPFTGLPPGTTGSRYKLRLVCNPIADMTFSGYTMDGILQPKVDYTRKDS